MLKSSANDSRPRIAVAGATGRVGSALIASLVSEPLDLVALTRNPDAQRVPSDVSLAVVDFDVPSSLEDALRGADRLFLRLRSTGTAAVAGALSNPEAASCDRARVLSPGSDEAR